MGGGDTGEVDEDERDRREMDEIRRRIEERKLSKEKKVVRTEVTEATKSAKSAAVSTSTKESRKEGRKDKDKACNIEEKISAGRRGSKKPAAPRAISSAADAAQREEAISWALGTVSETSVVKFGGGEKGVMRPKVQHGTSGRCIDIAGELAIQDFIASQSPPVEETVSSTVRMGRALVYGALGMRTDDPKYFETAVKMPECTVVLQSTRRKAKAPVSAPPPNSIESDRDLNESGDLHLSQSAADVGVFVELPGAIVESVNVGGHDSKIGENLNAVGTTDTSRTTAVASALEGLPPKESQQGVSQSQQGVKESQQGVKESQQGVKESQPDAAKAHDDPKKGEVTVVGTKEICVAERCRMLTEIEKSKLLRDELIRQDPSLATVTSFMSTVCSGPTLKNTGKDRVDDKIKATNPKGATTPGQSQPRADAKYVERQRLTRITAAKSLLEEELQKTRPSLESITAFRAAAYGEDKAPEPVTVEKDLAAVIETTVLTSGMSTQLAESRIGETSESGNSAKVMMAVVESGGAPATEVPMEANVATEIVVSDDAAMSVGDSDEEEESDGFSRSVAVAVARSQSQAVAVARGRPMNRLNARSLRRSGKNSRGWCRVVRPVAAYTFRR